MACLLLVEINHPPLHPRPHLISLLRILDNARLTFSPLPNSGEADYS